MHILAKYIFDFVTITDNTFLDVLLMYIIIRCTHYLSYALTGNLLENREKIRWFGSPTYGVLFFLIGAFIITIFQVAIWILNLFF